MKAAAFAGRDVLEQCRGLSWLFCPISLGLYVQAGNLDIGLNKFMEPGISLHLLLVISTGYKYSALVI